VPVVTYLEPASGGVAVEPARQYVGGRSSGSAQVTLSAPPETGYYRRYVAEHRYLAVLPTSLLDGLYRLHPWLPIVAIDAVLAGGIALLGLGVLRGRRVRLRRRQSRHDRSLLGRIRRRFR